MGAACSLGVDQPPSGVNDQRREGVESSFPIVASAPRVGRRSPAVSSYLGVGWPVCRQLCLRYARTVVRGSRVVAWRQPTVLPLGHRVIRARNVAACLLALVAAARLNAPFFGTRRCEATLPNPIATSFAGGGSFFFPRGRFPKWWTRGFSRVFWRVWRKPVKVAAPEAIGVPGGNRPLVGGFLLIVKPSRFWGFTVPHGLASPLGLTARSRSCSYPRIRHTILRETGFLRLKGIKGHRLGSVFRISVNVRD